ncbi:TIR domain-containing protein [Sphingomonas sp. GC_Shp_3]|uniref:TIR domain-containing protein n=1 Tax=Sphingomonas sp. GC_Shp_3 TaxID=2937383 RepID=UPI00226A07D6|nr:TIR domain-containing protein [Sphingomonas sp. GC_Shp_3]
MGGSGGGGYSRLGDVKGLEQKAKEALQGGRKNVFISFSVKDIDEVNLVRAHAKNENSDIEFNDRSVREPYNSERAEYIRSRLKERINQSSTTVVYVSENTAKSNWVEWEVKTSLELGKRVIAMYKGDAPPRNMPSWLQNTNITKVAWKDLARKLS